MRILQLITLSGLGGAQSVVINLANQLRKSGHDVIVVAGEGDGKMFSLLSPDVIAEHIPCLKRTLSPKDDWLALWELRRLYRKYKPDIVHLHSSKAGMLGRVAFPSSRVVYTVHGFDSIRVAYRKFLPVERVMQCACAAIVGVSRYDEGNLRLERITRNVSMIYNGIFVPEALTWNPFESIKGYKAKILCIARLSPPKKHDLFLAVAEAMPDFAFIWIGNQQPYGGKIPGNVFFMGNLPNAGAYNEYADLFMLPSNYEGLPMTIIEAMAYGKPVVASNVGGVSEIVRDGKNGYTVNNSVEAFLDKITLILGDENLKKSCSENSRKIYRSELTVDKMADAYLQIYNTIL